MRRSLLVVPLFAASLLAPMPAHAVSKEIIQLQTQVQALQDMLQHLQQSNDERMGVLQHLVEQSSDGVNRMQQQMTALQGQIEQSSKNDTLSSQIQGLNDSVDELKSRLNQVNKQLTDIESQLQNVQSVQSQPAPAAASPTPMQPQSYSNAPPTGYNSASNSSSGAGANQAAMPDVVPGIDPPLGPGKIQNYTAPAPSRATRGGAGNSYGAGGMAGAPVQAPPVEQLYQSALRDYNGARYDLSTTEFADVLKYYPGNPLAGNSSYYLGEISFRQGLYPAAIKYYDTVLEQFAGSARAPAAQLRKAQAELATQQRDAGIRDLRSLVQRYPTSPEGAQARSQLNGMGVRIVPNKPSAAR